MTNAWCEKAYQQLHYFLTKYKSPNIPEEWVVGVINVECASLNPKAKRFEPTVYQSVTTVKQGGSSHAFPGFNSGPIHDYIKNTNNIDRLKAVATSYGLGQLMGYHYINLFHLNYDQITNLSMEQSVQYLIKFLERSMGSVKSPYVEKAGKKYEPFEQLLRLHNSGSPTGKTFDPHYVDNATKAMTDYQDVLKEKGLR